jgi:hypothetical protein
MQRHSSYSGSMPWQIVRAQAKLRSTKLTMLSVLREKICSSDFSIFSLEGVGMCQPDKHGLNFNNRNILVLESGNYL